MGALASGGTLAVQMPDNLGEPSHLLMEETTRSPAFTDAFAGKTVRRNPMPGPATYVECLAPQAASIEVWHTIYYHRLANAEAIVEWVKGTGLRPYLDALPEDKRDAFAADYTDRIRAAYPAMSDGKVLLRFPRFFIVAVKA
ncbi:Trans-aconitate 2-methyltransferase [compost metagenome]